MGIQDKASRSEVDAQQFTQKSNVMAESILVSYRSVGCGIFGFMMRSAGMPLERIALIMNSSQISGSTGRSQFQQAVKRTFQDGLLAPYRVIGPSSIVSWFLQYSVMGFTFQLFDRGLSRLLGVHPAWYGEEIMESSDQGRSQQSMDFHIKTGFKTIAATTLASMFESMVSNRAEVQRFYGIKEYAKIEKTLIRPKGALQVMAGPAFVPNVARNMVMCHTTFVLIPTTYKFYFPQELKSQSSMFWYGLSMNIFVGNVVAITQQALWGRSLDFLAQKGYIRYHEIVADGLKRDGIAAFLTGPKWFSRVLMNSPAQGVLPWFYNEVLPLGEDFVLSMAGQIALTNKEEEATCGMSKNNNPPQSSSPLTPVSNRQ